MSLASVVAAVRNPDSNPQRACHRRLQHQWWPLPDLPPAPQEAHRRCLQHQWWPLPDLPPAPLKGLPLTSSTSVVAAVGPAASTPRGPAVDVFNISGGRCRKSRQQPTGGPPSTSPVSLVAAVGSADGTSPGGPPSTSPASVVATSTSRRPTVNVCLYLVPVARIFLATPTRGAAAVNIITTSKATSRKSEGWSFDENFWVLAVPRTRESYCHYRS
jgi:hypothetical protein